VILALLARCFQTNARVTPAAREAPEAPVAAMPHDQAALKVGAGMQSSHQAACQDFDEVAKEKGGKKEKGSGNKS
jgi:hypothetical protein